MIRLKQVWGALVFSSLVFVAAFACAQPVAEPDRTLSPYFYVKSDDPDLDRIPLKSTEAEVKISGVIADVVVTQVYKNEGRRPLEAIYIFPASTRAAVYGMTMTIGDRTITAKIAKREEARREYDEAKQTGKSASLLEQQRPNVFQMNVANILPSDVITVELRYTELLVPTDAVYEFVYPTVVGPRYTSSHGEDASKPGDDWTANPYLHQSDSPNYAFNIGVTLSAGLPIKEVSCPSHKVDILYEGPVFSTIHLDPSETYGGNRDFVLRYRLSGGQIETGLLLFEGVEENFFLLMLQPPKRVTEAQIPPREYIFVVDVSGSMNGFPLDISKKLLKDLIGNLRPTDKFNVLLFAGGSSLMSNHSLPATAENIQQAVTLIERQRGGGGTELLPALRRALALPKAEGISRSIVVATDGYVSVEAEAFDVIRSNLNYANLFAFGIGSSVNRHIIEGMARVGMGEPFVITKLEEAKEKAKKFRELIQSPVLAGIETEFDGFKAYDVEPLKIPDVLANRPVICFGKWHGTPSGHIRLRGNGGEGPFVKSFDVSTVKPFEANSALRYLWARHRIALLSDYNRLDVQDGRVKEVTALGLTYNLLTAYTSFVAIDTQVRLTGGQPTTVKQPLPLPQGVSDLAVGRSSSVRKMALTAAPGVSWRGTRDKSIVCNEESRRSQEKLHVRVKEVLVTGDLSKETVQEVIEKATHSMNNCYRGASTPSSCLKGEAVFSALVDWQGRVTRVKMEKGKDVEKAFEKCMLQILESLQFVARKGREVVVIKISFFLNS